MGLEPCRPSSPASPAYISYFQNLTSNNDCGKTFIDLANIFSFLNIFRWLTKSKAGSSQQHKPSTRRRGGPKTAPASANAGGEQSPTDNDDPENGTMQRWV